MAGSQGAAEIAPFWSCCGTCGMFAWWLTDCIRFGINYYPDSNGVTLKAW
jgi:hypothetical protein